MAEQQNRPAAQAANSGRRAGPPARPGAVAMQLNPERAPPLIAKWQKSLGKDLDKIEVVYDVEGVNVYLYGKVGTPFHRTDDSGDTISISVPEYKERKSAAARPTDEEALRAFKDKFELRLNMAFPANGPASGSEADIRAFLEGLEFRQRRAMLMSNKQFKANYPNGYTQV